MSHQVFISLALPWSVAEFKILRRILTPEGYLRRSKPPINDTWDSYAAYVWRQVGFVISEQAKLQCMPVMCYYDIQAPTEEERKQIIDCLDQIVETIVGMIPPSEWDGILRWMGLIG